MTPADYATLIALAALGGWAYWNARRMAQAEAEVIAENIEHGFDEELPHDELVWWRIEWVGSGWIAAWMILAAVLLLGLDGSWKVALSLGVPLACVAWAVFTVTHRYTLNKARKHFPWWYVADGNVYDRVFLNITGGRVKAAGLVAYAFEVLVAAAGVTVAMWIA